MKVQSDPMQFMCFRDFMERNGEILGLNSSLLAVKSYCILRWSSVSKPFVNI